MENAVFSAPVNLPSSLAFLGFQLNRIKADEKKKIRYSITKGHNGGKGLVEMYAARKEGRRPDDRKYVRRRYPLTLKQINQPKREEVAMLLDMSVRVVGMCLLSMRGTLINFLKVRFLPNKL